VPSTITRVVITGATANIALGDLRTLQAQGFDASNNVVPTAAFTWTTSASNIARLVTNAGSSVDVQGYSAGTATITATETASTRAATAIVTIATSDTLSWDTFTGTNGTALTAHMPDSSQVGGGWTTSGSAAPTLQSGLARVTTAGTASSRIYATQDATLSDVQLSTDWSVRSATAWGGLVLRWTDANNFLFVGYTGSGELAIYEMQGGTWTRRVGAPITAASGTVHQIEVMASGSSLQVLWDGVLTLQTTDSFNQTATRHGLAWANGIDTLSGYDTFRLAGTLAPPPPPPAPSPGPSPAPAPAPGPAPGPVPGPTPCLIATGDPNGPTSPFAPSQFWATVDGATVVLHWTPPTAIAASSYVGEAGSVSGGLDQANSNLGNVLDYTATAVPPNTYYVRMRALVGNTPTAASNEIIVVVGSQPSPCGCGALATPTSLTFGVSGSNVTLLWSYPVSATPPGSFVIEAGSFSGGANLANFDTLSTVKGYFAPGVGPGTYFVRVRAKNACGVSGSSNEIVVKVGP